MQLVGFLQTSFQNVRSSKRTDDLHKVLLSETLSKNPQWRDLDWKFEYKLPVDAFGGTFDIDIAGFDVDGNLKVCILAKAMNSNVNKNIKNYANTTIGEAARLAFAPDIELEKILFVSVLPRVAPRFKKDGTVGGFDDVISAKNRTKIDGVLRQQYGDLVELKDILFDIADVRNKKTKDEFNDIIVENII
jgi:hypothetical protein|tara:strand:- start:788 stop:1357 length:570 start_codon:yes stop_codon:yes gene_type:complete